MVVVGGDGTVRQVAGALAGSGVPLGIVPTGTANLFARNVGLPARLSAQVSTALTGTPTRSDVGWARFRRGAEWSGEPVSYTHLDVYKRQISENTLASRTRRAISCAYWAPKSMTITESCGCAMALSLGLDAPSLGRRWAW